MDEPLYKDRDWLYQKIVIENKSHAKAAEEIGCSRSAVATWASKYGIKRERIWERLMRESGKEIGRLYTQEDYTLKTLAETYGCAESVIRRILSELEIPLRTMSEAKFLRDKEHIHRKYSLNEDYFKTWSSDMAYILGFIYSDGNIMSKPYTNKKGYTKRRNYLKIALQEDDREILEKIKSKLEYDGKLLTFESKISGRPTGTKHCELRMTSLTLITDLLEIGLMDNKSLIKTFPDVPSEYEMDFIRGYFDGNGSVGVQYPTNSKDVRSKTAQIRVRISSGSLKMLERMQEILTKHELKPKGVSSGRGARVNVHEICYSTRESLVLFEALYGDRDALKMTRKYEEFNSAVNLRISDIAKSKGSIKVKTKNNNEMEND